MVGGRLARFGGALDADDFALDFLALSVPVSTADAAGLET